MSAPGAPLMSASPSALNVPNAITVARIFLVPPLVVLLLHDPRGSIVAALVFGVGALSDVLDGHLARSRGLVTTLGKLLDPVADKLLVGAALVALVIVGRLAVWVPAVILAREVLVTALRVAATRRGIIIAASPFGKAKMALQIAMVLALIATPDPEAAWVGALVLATVVATIASGAEYAAGYRRAVGKRTRTVLVR